MNWNGLFTPPLRKHRLGTGDIKNHIEIKHVEKLDDPDDLPEDAGDELGQITELGVGDIPWLVTIGWVASGDTEYEYIILSDEKPSDDQAQGMIAEYVEEENARRRARGAKEIRDEG